MGAGLMSGVSGSQRARSCGLPGLWRRHWGLGSVLRPIVRVGYGWGQICGCPAGPKFSSSAMRLRAMLGMAGRYQDLLRRRSRVARTRPELSVLLSAADPRARRRRSATAIMEALPRLGGRQRSRTSAEFACEVLRHGGFGGRPILLF